MAQFKVLEKANLLQPVLTVQILGMPKVQVFKTKPMKGKWQRKALLSLSKLILRPKSSKKY
jgi:hypothetical protein